MPDTDETRLSALLDRAAGPADLPPGLTARVIARSRTRRRARAALTFSAVATAAVVGGVTLPGLLAEPPPPPIAATTRVEEDIYTILSRDTGMKVTAEDVILSGRAGDLGSVAVLRKEANPPEAEHGGKAASLWFSRDGGRYTQVSDYISFDLACKKGDEVCDATQDDGLGFFGVLEGAGGAYYALVQVPAGRSVTVSSDKGEDLKLEGNAGVVRVEATNPWRVKATVTVDTLEYGLHLPPGGVVKVL
ncbi:hypothetical protein [Sinosporangium siamense]|uniref:Uncharacterized protein n=1 Tax=Sinosporangium siamense TaxID=1367973 RepID=A0A919V4W9_9ACTN|nr:hypothetical protein [Sinosporangium siamense]GII90933.1 hypothetical protein Ssi02_11640 [Sinosporangium siamense]